MVAAMGRRGREVNGLRVAQARLALPGRPTQAEFAARVGIHWVTQSNIENGKAKVSLELLERVAEETGLDRDHFLADDDDDEESSMPLARDLADVLTAVVRQHVRAELAAAKDRV